MQKIPIKSLEHILDQDEFMAVQDELSNLLQFSVVTVTKDGIPIGHWNNFSEFCRLIRSSKKGFKSCVDCDRQASLHALELGVPQSYICHCGLHDCSAPIIVEGEYLGSVLGGQILTNESERKNIDVNEIATKFDLKQEDVQTAVNNLKIVSEDYVKKCMQFYSFMATYLAQISIKKIIEQSLINETNENLKLLQIVKEQELKRMKAQMNPHFLFNALNSIARTALLEDAPKAEKLIYELSDYLRYTIKSTDEMPPIRLELDNLMHYIEIQKTRFGDRISFFINIDNEILDSRIPSMALQPIVENSIVHGIESLECGGEIKILGKKDVETSDIYIKIIDNGVGFPDKVIELFNKNCDLDSANLGLGLLNTHIRIQHEFGKKYGISITSIPFVSNCVTIRIPDSK